MKNILSNTQYSEYVGLKPLKLYPWDLMYITLDGKLTNIPQGKTIGNFLPHDFHIYDYQKELYIKLENETCI